MPIRVKCDNCKKTLSVKDHLAGKKIKCPVCQSVVAVSAMPAAKPSAPAAAPAPQSTTAPAKKPPTVPKPGVAVKPPVDMTKTNGTPAGDKSKSNGKPAKTEEPPIELPLENIEDAALAAFADEPKPVPAEDEAPKTVDFKCQWCDEDVKMPIEMAGKQAPCPNPECRRIVKVPLPKPVEKGDWRKMERQGPAAARINAPEQLDNAWGTEEATKARQGSLAQAGAIALPPPKPRNWVRIGIYGMGGLLLLGFATAGVLRLRTSTQQTNALKDASSLISGAEPKVKHPCLAAEVNRTLGLLYFRASVRTPAFEARDQFQGAASRIKFELTDKDQAIDEQLFLIELALSQIELGGDGDDLLTKKKLPWKDVLPEVVNTLRKIENPEVQVMALREIDARFLERKQSELAISAATMLSNVANDAKPPAFRQQIALMSVRPGQEEMLKTLAKMPDLDGKEEVTDGNARVGFAEGMARKENYEGALKLARLPGPLPERIDASLGVAAVAWQDRNVEETKKFVKVAVTLLGDKNPVTPWQLLLVVKLAARVDDADSLKVAMGRLDDEQFKRFQLRAQLEVFRAMCEKSTGRIDADKLAELETADKEGVTLALAWLSLAEHNTRFTNASRANNRNDLESRISTLELPPAMLDQIRGMVDIGTYLGSMK